MSVLAPHIDSLSRIQPMRVIGTVASVRGMTIFVDDLPLPIGALVRIVPRDTNARVPGSHAGSGGDGGGCSVDLPGEVVGFDGAQSIVMLLAASVGIAPGMHVVGEQTAQTVRISRSMLGRVVDGLGRPIDGDVLPMDVVSRPLLPPPTSAMRRSRITEPLPTGIRAIDGFLTVGRGQRLGIFSAAGVGKSTLLGTIARNTEADINIIALIGERGREVREFIDEALGVEGLQRSIVVVATSDESPLMRVRAAHVACAYAEYFRECGADVMLMMDSITRFAQAQRQIGLAVGEQPATRGYTPSVFALLPTLLERAGSINDGGSITGFYAVLVEGDDLDEPISDAARGVLDGHIILSRRLAARGHFPAIDVLESISRVANEVSDRHHQQARRHLLRLLAAYRDSEELINIGAYARGSNLDCDVALQMREDLWRFLRQERTDPAEYPATCRAMIELSGLAEQIAQQVSKRRDTSPGGGGFGGDAA